MEISNKGNSTENSNTSIEHLCQDSDSRLKIHKYIDIIIDYNKRINIIGHLNRTQIIHNLIEPSLMSLSLLNSTDRHIIDIGSGSGVVGITVKLVIKNVNLMLIEKNSKKIAFLNEVITKLDIDNVELLHDLLENIDRNRLQHVDQLLIRGIKLVKILETIREKVPRGTKIVYFGSEKDVEIPAITIHRQLPMPGNESREHPLYIYSLSADM